MNFVKRVIIFVVLVSTSVTLSSQTDDWDILIEQLAEESIDADGDDESSALADDIDELTDLHENPLNLNTVSRADLLRLPFVSEAQVDAILDYRSRNHQLHSIEELRLIPEISMKELRWLRLCTFVSDEPVASQSSVRQRNRHEILTRFDVPLYQRQGWNWARGIANRLRYTTQIGNRWDFGARAEKDAGEPMFTNANPVWDSWGAHAMLKDWRFVETFIVGDFKASMGEGLVINNGFHLGKQLTSLWRRTSVLRPHRSADESNFLRGVGITLRLAAPLSFSAIYSYRQLDATVQPDNSLQSINTSGLHRTASELARRRTLGCHTTAAHLAWDAKRVRLGTSAMYQYYDHQFRQGSALYRQINPSGYQFGSVGADYGLHLGHLYVSGETARSFAARSQEPDAVNNSSGRGWATINKGMWRFSPSTAVTLVQRFYSRNYFSALASAFGENQKVQNESGIALMVDADRVGPLAVRAYVDYFYSPWPRYTMTRASHGIESAVQATYPFRRGRQLTLRYSLKSKERTDRRYRTNRLRINYVHALSDVITLQAAAYATHVAASSPSQRATGLAFVPRFDYSALDGRWRCSLAATLFATGLGAASAYVNATYDSRFFLYEPSLYQSFGMVNLFGRGERLAASARWRVSPRWQLQAKCGVTHYSDRSSISQGPTLIRSPWRTDLQLLVRWLLK